MKKIILFVGALLLLIAVPITVYFLGTQQELRSKAAPATKLSFSPATINKPVDEQFSINIQIDTGDNSVAAAKLSISFDATALEAMSITNGPFAPKITASGIVSPGLATITVAAESTTKPINGTGAIAVLRMRGKGSATPVTIKFDQTTFVSGLQESTNVLTTTGIASVTITGGSQVAATLSPIPTTSSTISPTPMPTETITPTDILSPTPDPEATASAETFDGTGGAAGEEMPVSGSPLPTLLSFVVALGFLLVGGIIRFAPQKNL